MSINEAMVILRDVREFSVGAAEFIALEVASGASVKELHEHHEDLVPSPLVVNRWRKQYPAFDLVMKEAEQAKAETLADEVIEIAKNEDRQAAISGNMIKARQWLAGKLSEDFESKKGGSVVINQNVRLSDDQLMAIAAGGVPALEGESERVGKVRPGDTDSVGPAECSIPENNGSDGEEETVVVGEDEAESGLSQEVSAPQVPGSEEAEGWDFL
jgi:hypothetical protein